MNKLIYLPSGQQAELINELPNNQYLVDPLMSFQDPQTGEWYDVPSGVRIVNQVFENPPVEKISEKIRALNLQMKNAQEELKQLSNERHNIATQLRQLKTEVTDISKWRIDLKQFRECKSFAFFVEDRIAPVVIGDAKKLFGGRSFKVFWSVDMHNGKVATWVSSVEIERDYNDSTTHKLDEEYPFMFDISDEELISITKDRSDKLDLNKLHYTSKSGGVPEQFMTERVKRHFEEEKEAARVRQIEAKRAQIEKLQKELNEAIS